MDEIKADLDHGIADCVAADLALLEHLLERHAAFDAYCQALSRQAKPSGFAFVVAQSRALLNGPTRPF